MKPVWTPSVERIARANMTRFLAEARQEEPSLDGFSALFRWSVENPDRFWARVWSFCGVVASRTWDQVVDHPRRMPGARWFSGARLNFAENLLRYRDQRIAVVAWNEEGRQAELSYAELYAEVSRVAQALRASGVGTGDRVVGFLPNIPAAIIAMLATSSLGATWSSCSPDFGVKGVLDRFGQIEPKVLFTADGYRFAGKTYDSLGRMRRVLAELPALAKVVVVPYLSPTPPADFDDRMELWPQFIADYPAAEIDFVQLPFDHPLYILYSSGTTGLPKCMVHGAGGTLIQHLKELVLHTDLTRQDAIFYFTTCGWMMWNWLASSLAVGAKVVLWDGSPLAPRPAALWDMAERDQISVFGTSAKYLALAEKEGVVPRTEHDLRALRTLLSTGSPLAHESYDYVYRDIKEDLCLSSISGGTDLISCFALGNPVAPVFRGELQTRGLGMAVEVWDQEGKPLVGEKGELVCTRAFPSMPVGFWDDSDGSRYRAAYFEYFPGIWRHGDWAEFTARGGLIIHGRSDATLNPGGVRIGTAEIYRQVEQLDEVVEALVVGQRWQDDVRVVLFVCLRQGLQLDEVLKDQIRRQIRHHASPFHVPKVIVQVADIPRTRSGKITELAVRAVIHGQPVKNADALANPEALKLFEDLPELA